MPLPDIGAHADRGAERGGRVHACTIVMAKEPQPPAPAAQDDANARLVTSESDRAKAVKCFQRALEVGEKRRYDFAIEYYLQGLEQWPDAVDDGLKPMHACGVARRLGGGGKPGLKDSMTHPTGGKDVRKAFVNALWLFAHDPENLGYMEAVFSNACRLRADDAAMWAARTLLRALETTAKVSSKTFQSFVNQLEQLGDRAAARGDATMALSAFQFGMEVYSQWQKRVPRDRDVENGLRNLSTKMTILRGKYQTSETFRDSMEDAEQQREIHDRDRIVQSDERLNELITHAEQEYRDNPNAPGALRKLVDLLTRRERDEEEARAIGHLVKEYQRTSDYNWKLRADDIRIKQLGRATRRAVETGDPEAIREARVRQLRYELQVYKERVDRYPTDNRLKFEYGSRLFFAGRFDEAIPILQSARVDPKNRTECALYLGRCFYKKGYHDQAVATLREGIEQHEFPDDDLAKSLLYWLARAYEESGYTADARKAYGRILQLDYNYQDVRARMDGLAGGHQGTAV